MASGSEMPRAAATASGEGDSSFIGLTVNEIPFLDLEREDARAQLANREFQPRFDCPKWDAGLGGDLALTEATIKGESDSFPLGGRKRVEQLLQNPGPFGCHYILFHMSVQILRGCLAFQPESFRGAVVGEPPPYAVNRPSPGYGDQPA